jgi:hypothetical protein
VITFVYIDYGFTNYIKAELLYSISTLLYEYCAREAHIEIYTDRPQAYNFAGDRIRLKDISDEVADMSRNGLYNHRIKPCVLLRAAKSAPGPCVLLDTDTFVFPGFADALDRALINGGAVMDQYETHDPWPEMADLAASLPHSGTYKYGATKSVTYNSGLIGVVSKDAMQLMEDAIRLIDACIDSHYDRFTIEQIAISEVLRIYGVPVVTMRGPFHHYCVPSEKRYMRYRLVRNLRQGRVYSPNVPKIIPSRLEIRVFNALNRAYPVDADTHQG